MTTISENTVRHVAELVKLEVKGEEAKLARMFAETIDFIKVMDEVDTAAVYGTAQVTGLTNVYQATDKPDETLEQGEVLANAPESIDGLFVTNAVLER